MSEYTRLRDEVVAAIAINGRCKSNEARDMARELQEFRAAQPKQNEVEGFNPYASIFPNIP